MRILLAEDDASIQAIAVLALRRVGGHEVTTVNDGVQLLEQVGEARPDVILLDVMMPNLDGFEACARLKANPATRDIPVVFLTARAQVHEMKRGMSLGAMGYILKPFDPMDLARQVEEVLKSHDA